jgi:hypothetical protein
MRGVVLLLLLLVMAAPGDAAAPRARIVGRAALPSLAEAAVASDGTSTWLVFRPDDSPPYAALVAGNRLVPGPRLTGIFSPTQLLGATRAGLWFAGRRELLRISPHTGLVEHRLPLPRGTSWTGTTTATGARLLWWGATAFDPARRRVVGTLATPAPVAGRPLIAASSIWLAAGDAVRRYSPRTGLAQQTIRWRNHIPTAAPVLLRGRLWVAFQKPDLAASEVDVRALDPRTGRLGATLTLPAIPGSENAAVIMRPVDLHAAAGALWLVRPQVAKAYARLYRLDTSTRAVTSTVAVPYTNLTRLAWRGPELWTTDGRVVFDLRVR